MSEVDSQPRLLNLLRLQPFLKRLAIVGGTSICLAACSNAYRDIESRFPPPGTVSGHEVVAPSVALFARVDRDAGSAAHFLARFGKGYVILEPAGIDTLFFSSVQIPVSEIYGCEVVDFGRAGVDINFPLLRADAAFMAPDKGRLLKWCWENNLPSLSKEDYGTWQSGRAASSSSRIATQPKPWEEYREEATNR